MQGCEIPPRLRAVLLVKSFAKCCYPEFYNNDNSEYQEVPSNLISLLKLRHSFFIVAIVLCACIIPNFQTRISKKLSDSVPIMPHNQPLNNVLHFVALGSSIWPRLQIVSRCSILFARLLTYFVSGRSHVGYLYNCPENPIHRIVQFSFVQYWCWEISNFRTHRPWPRKTWEQTNMKEVMFLTVMYLQEIKKGEKTRIMRMTKGRMKSLWRIKHNFQTVNMYLLSCISVTNVKCDHKMEYQIHIICTRPSQRCGISRNHDLPRHPFLSLMHMQMYLFLACLSEYLLLHVNC